MYQIWRIYLDLWGYDCKKWVWPTFGCKLCQNDPIVVQLKIDIPCHLLTVYTKFQIDISKHVEEKSGKRGRMDGRTDGQTGGHCHGIIRPFFKRAYDKNHINTQKVLWPVWTHLPVKYPQHTYICMHTHTWCTNSTHTCDASRERHTHKHMVYFWTSQQSQHWVRCDA